VVNQISSFSGKMNVFNKKKSDMIAIIDNDSIVVSKLI